jgi:hypothetical protein
MPDAPVPRSQRVCPYLLRRIRWELFMASRLTASEQRLLTTSSVIVSKGKLFASKDASNGANE